MNEESRQYDVTAEEARLRVGCYITGECPDHMRDAVASWVKKVVGVKDERIQELVDVLRETEEALKNMSDLLKGKS